MSRALLSTASLAVVVGLVGSSCRSTALQTPWQLGRGTRVTQLGEGQTQLGLTANQSEGDGFANGSQAKVEYGVTPQLTLGLSLGESLRRSGWSRQGLADEVGAVNAIWGWTPTADNLSLATQLEVVFDDNDVEFRPSMGCQYELGDEAAVTGRLGLTLVDGRDERLFFESAYRRRVGSIQAMVEFDGDLGDGPDAYYLSPGLVTQFRDIVQLQVSAPIGLSNAAADWQLLTGLLFRF